MDGTTSAVPQKTRLVSPIVLFIFLFLFWAGGVSLFFYYLYKPHVINPFWFNSLLVLWAGVSFGYFGLYLPVKVYKDGQRKKAAGGLMESIIKKAKDNEKLYKDQIFFLQTLMDLVPFPLFYKDSQGHFITCNASFCVVFDVKKDDVIGKKNLDIFNSPNAENFEKIETIATANRYMAVEEGTFLHMDGTLHEFILYFLPYSGMERYSQGYLGVLIDITIRKEKEAKLVQLNATKDQLFSIISHDLRGPVGKLKQLLDIYVDDPKLFDKTTWEQVFKDMRKSADSLLQLLETLLSWARSQKGDYQVNMQPMDLEAAVADLFSLLKLLASDKKIRLVSDIHLDSQVVADKTILSTILRNLVHNALKFTPTGGEVALIAREKPEGMEIIVRDTGLGMNEEMLERIFKKHERLTTYGTEKERGQGLGISVCLDLAQKMGIKVDVESAVGLGTTFRLLIPTDELEGVEEYESLH